MILSKFNIVSKLKDKDEYFILNPLSSNADIIDKETYLKITNNNYQDIITDLIDKGYVVEEDKEKVLFEEKYKDFIDKQNNDEVQIFFAPTYACNFACSYCYQKEYSNEEQELTSEIIDAFFAYTSKKLGNRRRYITLFGGEPLLNGEKYKENIKYFFKKAEENFYKVAIVTNGYNLEEYLEFINHSIIREIQVTLDGVGELHDKRRKLINDGGTFEKISNSIDKALEYGISINLRVVFDKENAEGLIDLAKYAKNKGWTESPNFKTQIGRNYELHTCFANKSALFSRIEMYQKLHELIEKDRVILDFHKPAFSISKFIIENEGMPDPMFDSCPACKNEWAFDYTGNIYSCTATVGKQGEELGTFYPEVIEFEEKIEEIKGRNIISIKECNTCNLSLVCGGGCYSVAKNKTGQVKSPDCRPVKELLEMGLSLYDNLYNIDNNNNYERNNCCGI